MSLLIQELERAAGFYRNNNPIPGPYTEWGRWAKTCEILLAKAYTIGLSGAQEIIADGMIQMAYEYGMRGDDYD